MVRMRTAVSVIVWLWGQGLSACVGNMHVNMCAHSHSAPCIMVNICLLKCHQLIAFFRRILKQIVQHHSLLEQLFAHLKVRCEMQPGVSALKNPFIGKIWGRSLMMVAKAFSENTGHFSAVISVSSELGNRLHCGFHMVHTWKTFQAPQKLCCNVEKQWQM